MEKKNAIIGGILTLIVASGAPAAAPLAFTLVLFMGSLTISASFHDHNFVRTCTIFAILVVFKTALDLGGEFFNMTTLYTLIGCALYLTKSILVFTALIVTINAVIFRYITGFDELKKIIVFAAVYEAVWIFITGDVF